MAGESSKDEWTKTILLFEEKTSSRFNWSVFELIQYCVFFSEKFSSQRMRSLGDSGEILVVHLKKLFRRPRSASRLLFTLCPIPFFCYDWCPLSQKRHFSDSWLHGVRSGPTPYLPGARFLWEIFSTLPWTFLLRRATRNKAAHVLLLKQALCY